MKKQLLLITALLSAGALYADDDEITKKDLATTKKGAVVETHLDVAKTSLQKAVRVVPKNLSEEYFNSLKKALDTIQDTVAKLHKAVDSASTEDND